MHPCATESASKGTFVTVCTTLSIKETIDLVSKALITQNISLARLFDFSHGCLLQLIVARAGSLASKTIQCACIDVKKC